MTGVENRPGDGGEIKKENEETSLETVTPLRSPNTGC